MQSKAKNISEYLNEIPEDRKEAIVHLRTLCLKILKKYEESMDYGMPCYKRNGSVEIAFASQKNYISLYVLKHEVVKKHKNSLKGIDVGKSCIKYAKPDRIDFGVVSKLLKDTLNSKDSAC